METFADWLLKELKNKNMSQADLARASGVTNAQISRVIGGSRGVGPEALAKIAKALHASPEYVFELAGVFPKTSDDPWADSMRYKISHLTGARREMAERLLNTLLDEQDRESRSQPHNTPIKP